MKCGAPSEDIPGKRIVIPMALQEIQVLDLDLEKLRRSYVRNSIRNNGNLNEKDVAFIAEDLQTTCDRVHEMIQEVKGK